MGQLDKLLLAAIGEKDLGGIERLIRLGADVNARVEGMPILHIAVVNAMTPVVERLIAAGVDVHACDADGRTALALGAWVGSTPEHVRILDQLLAAGADPNPRDNQGRQPIDWAAQFLNRQMVNWLIAAGVTPSALARQFLAQSSDKEGPLLP
ncbi:MAG: ankyrin repeat domain-containing protein [Planctomycetota bacterium]